MCKAIDMQEITERVSIRNHGSFLFHGAVYKVSRDILAVGDVWAVSLSSLELLNAETKRKAEQAGSRRLTFGSESHQRVPLRDAGKEGPAQLVTKRAYQTTMALSTLNNMLATNYLRKGDGIIALPDSRRRERLFGLSGGGRTRREASGVKMERLNADYDPRADTCIRAFVRLLALLAQEKA